MDTVPDDGDRVVIEIDPNGPLEVSGLTQSFSGLARFYERHYRPHGEPAPKLYVTRMYSGSIVAEIAPYAIIVGGIVATMDGGMVVADFTRRLAAAIRAFAEWPLTTVGDVRHAATSTDDAADIKEFVKPLAGRKGASLKIKHARLEKNDGRRRMIAEYTFDEAAINRATVNIDSALEEGEAEAIATAARVAHPAAPSSKPRSEVMLFIEQASQRPGKPKGRTADRGAIPEISAMALPIYFLQSLQGLKDQMIKGEVNPFTTAFVVDVMVHYLGDEARGYTITNVRALVPVDDQET